MSGINARRSRRRTRQRYENFTDEQFMNFSPRIKKNKSIKKFMIEDSLQHGFSKIDAKLLAIGVLQELNNGL